MTTEEFKTCIESCEVARLKEPLKEILSSAPQEILAELLNPEWIEKRNPATVAAIHRQAFQTFKETASNAGVIRVQAVDEELHPRQGMRGWGHGHWRHGMGRP